MKEEVCLQCKIVTETASNRLVQDSCGHLKCRICLLNDEKSCKQCFDLNTYKTEKGNIINNDNLSIISNGYHKEQNINQKQNIKTNLLQKERKTNKVDTKLKKDKRTYNEILIPNHITVSVDANSYLCTICNKQFTTKAHVKYHSYCAGALKLFKCDVCNKDFILKTQLDMHLYKHQQQAQYTCNVCGKSFIEKSKMKRHSLVHSKFKSHVCSMCGKKFKTMQSLKVHYIIHKEDKPFSCSTCKAKFNNSSNLKKHLASHSSEKVHMCDQCGKRFKLKCALSVHQKSHLKSKEFQCLICQRTFVINKDLQRHQLIHLENKAFTCSICKTSFRRKDNLSRHIKNIHPGKKAKIIEIKTSVSSEEPMENPNAIKVITASPVFTKPTYEISTQKMGIRNSSVINGPPKLAFKTPAFKTNYNINRELQSQKTYDIAESVNICQKILSPHTATIKTINEPSSSQICQTTLESHSTPLHYETSFQNQKHAQIKNIKFKVPIQYTNNHKTEERCSNLIHDTILNKGNKHLHTTNDNNFCSEIDNRQHAATSVIVNNQPGNMHWRRRTSQTLIAKQ
ncbi:unnamed protein product [Brassicogethes aeneus]|uniref:C2H2-type domain-containing protein n=1 Tax=Brassicogethes aeneus TaxID=1431903 RepID=A0A9P0FIR3_BRAAE|nr:unnamed protein product [Brassicogethes aeneus]